MDEQEATAALTTLLRQLDMWQNSERNPAWIKWRDETLMLGSPLMETQINAWLGLPNCDVGGLISRSTVLEALKAANWTLVQTEGEMGYWKKY